MFNSDGVDGDFPKTTSQADLYMRLESRRLISLSWWQVHGLGQGLCVMVVKDNLTFMWGGLTCQMKICRQKKEITCPNCQTPATVLLFNPRLWLTFPLYCHQCRYAPRTTKQMEEMMDLPEDYDAQALLLASQHMQAIAIKSSVFIQKTLEQGEMSYETISAMNATKNLFVASSIGFVKHKQMQEKWMMDQNIKGAPKRKALPPKEEKDVDINPLSLQAEKVMNHE